MRLPVVGGGGGDVVAGVGEHGVCLELSLLQQQQQQRAEPAAAAAAARYGLSQTYCPVAPRGLT